MKRKFYTIVNDIGKVIGKTKDSIYVFHEKQDAIKRVSFLNSHNKDIHGIFKEQVYLGKATIEWKKVK